MMTSPPLMTSSLPPMTSVFSVSKLRDSAGRPLETMAIACGLVASGRAVRVETRTNPGPPNALMRSCCLAFRTGTAGGLCADHGGRDARRFHHCRCASCESHHRVLVSAHHVAGMRGMRTSMRVDMRVCERQVRDCVQSALTAALKSRGWLPVSTCLGQLRKERSTGSTSDWW